MEFIKSDSMKVDVFAHQKTQISSKEKIKTALTKPGVFGFDIFENGNMIGFVMIRQFADKKYFLWNYAIHKDFQNMGFGKKALKEFIEFIKKEFNATLLTTTYKWGNIPAKNLYKQLGFIETEIIDEVDAHEVDMMLEL